MKSSDDEDFDKFWLIYPKRPGANKLQTRKQWDARIKQGAFPEEMIYGAMRYAGYCKELKIEPQYIKQASTFIGPNKHYLSEWSAVSKQNARKSWADRLTGKDGDESTIDI
jgi:hypothetical protein